MQQVQQRLPPRHEDAGDAYPGGIKLSHGTVRSLVKTKVFKGVHSDVVNSLDFSPDGERLLCAGDDGVLSLYSATQGTLLKCIPVKRYGCGPVRFGNHKSHALVASKPPALVGGGGGGAAARSVAPATAASAIATATTVGWDDNIRYLSLHENKYVRYFRGHRSRVVSMAVSPLDDTFLSASLDRTMRLWDIRYPQCAGVLRVRGRPSVAYDPSGMVAAVAYSDLQRQVIKLYDLRSWDAGPFIDFESAASTAEPTVLRFANDGKHLLVSSAEPNPSLQLLDAFNGSSLMQFRGHSNDAAHELDAGFSADSRYVFSGSEDCSIHLWDRATGSAVHQLHGHSMPVRAVQFNPQYAMLASACQAVVFWQPAAARERQPTAV